MPSSYLKQPVFFELADAMKQRGMTLRSFADACDIDKTTLFRLLHGQLKRMPVDLISKVQIASGGTVGLLEFSAYFQRISKNEVDHNERMVSGDA